MPEIGKTISHYSIVKKIGEGGMGEVYLAEDKSLGRKVALKFLPPEMQSDPIAHMRFQREARSASALDHPYICSIHEVGEAEGKDYIVMEFVEGETLQARLERGSLPLLEALHLAAEITEAIDQAHEKQIIHRDLKPSNIMITRQGHAKVMDFGLAKQVMRTEQAVTREDTLTALTREGTTVGTLAYMSPEQLRGQGAEARSDIFSFGIILFEMLTGVHPFRQASPMDTAAAILNRAPAPMNAHLKNAPDLLHKITARMLAKELAARYSSMREVRADLALLIKQLEQAGATASAAENRGLWQRLGKPVFVVLALLVIIALGYLAATTIQQNRKTRWAREVALPKIEKLLAKDDWLAAYHTAVEAEKYIPNDPQLKEAFADASKHISIRTDPPGARVYFKEYAKGDESWEFAGLSPIENLRISRGFKEYKITRDGFDPMIGFSGSDQKLAQIPRLQIRLDRKLAKAGTTSQEMIWIEGGKYKPTIIDFSSLPEADLEPYQIDQFEVSNKEYQTFVDAGGYALKNFWKHDFVKEGRKLSWVEAVSGFVDKTGRPGPSTWELGHFPDGHENYPVGGISWFEAAAYAEFKGKSLPTVYHWNKAAGVGDSLIQAVVRNSNFGDAGPAPVGKYGGISPYGAFDMAGNVREWIWNGSSDRRYLLGASWGVPEYVYFKTGELLSSFDRSASNGFRCIKLSSGRHLPELTMAEIPGKSFSGELGKLKPVSDDLFKVYRGYFSYDKGPLDPKIEAVEDSSEYYLRERVSFNAAYGGERVVAYLYLPKNTKKPYQSVIIFPGSGAMQLSSIDAYFYPHDMFFKSGRAVVFPIYKSTFQRRPVDYSTPALARDLQIMIYKDLARTLDYLETRTADFDINKVGYFGLSWGAWVAPIMGALEKRIKVFVLEAGGLIHGSMPEADPVNFEPRHIAPTLMLNGKYDMSFPLETSARPFFQLLGTPAKDKKFVLLDGGHLPPLTTDVKREMLLWLDRYLGPVR
jgi:formylglycine-generating enzyme required for sulfatase activity/dienelactone hydrolase